MLRARRKLQPLCRIVQLRAKSTKHAEKQHLKSVFHILSDHKDVITPASLTHVLHSLGKTYDPNELLNVFSDLTPHNNQVSFKDFAEFCAKDNLPPQPVIITPAHQFKEITNALLRLEDFHAQILHIRKKKVTQFSKRHNQTPHF